MSEQTDTPLNPSRRHQLLCEASGDRCYGCDHYYDKHPVCEHSPHRKRFDEIQRDRDDEWRDRQIAEEMNFDLERQLAEARKDSERLDWLLSYVGNEEANGKLIFWKACRYDTREDIDQVIARIDAAIRSSQTENGDPQ